jgi:hypothetical protein
MRMYDRKYTNLCKLINIVRHIRVRKISRPKIMVLFARALLRPSMHVFLTYQLPPTKDNKKEGMA